MDEQADGAGSTASPPAPGSRWDRCAPLVLLGLLVAFALHVLHLECVAEDSYITYRFSRNLAEGHGILWNLGEPPVEGYTNFLWMVLVGGAMKLGFDAATFGQVAGACFGAATIALLYRLGHRVLSWRPAAALLPAALLALCGPFAAWAGSGMETVLFTFLAFAAFHQLAVHWRTESRVALLGCHVTLVFATMTRPEGFMLFGLFTVAGVLLGTRDIRTSIRTHLIPVIAYLVLFGIYFGWRFDRYGYAFPNTFYAKTGRSLAQVKRGVLQDLAFIGQFIGPVLPILLLSLWSRTSGFIDRRVPGLRRYTDALRHQPVASLALVVVGVYGAYITSVGGDYMAMHRFFVPLLPFIYLLVGHAFEPLLKAGRERALGRPTLTIAVAVALGVTVLHSTPAEKLYFTPTPYGHGNYRGIAHERWHVERLKLIGKWIEDHRGDDERGIGTNAIGAISFFTRLPVYGVHGLVDPEIAHTPAKEVGGGRPGHERNALAVVLRHEPRYLLIYRYFTQEPSAEGLLKSVPDELREEVLATYEHKWVELDDRFNGERGIFNYFERRD